MTATAPAASLEPARALVERTIGRPLRLAEQAIDVLRLDRELNRAKDDLEAAIRSEMLHAASAWLAGVAIAPEVRVTAAMLDVLFRLEELGREEARLELERLGYQGVKYSRSYAGIEGAPHRRDTIGYLLRNLPALRIRIEDELIHLDLANAARGALEDAIARLAGARDIASRVISTALIDGLGQTWEQNADLVERWEYTAVLDAATCEECEPLDGTEYDSLEALFEVLPDFGPNPLCLGEGRCRCRAVPASP